MITYQLKNPYFNEEESKKSISNYYSEITEPTYENLNILLFKSFSHARRRENFLQLWKGIRISPSDVHTLVRFSAIPPEISMNVVMRNILSHNLSKEDPKLGLEKICMLFMLFLKVLMEWGETCHLVFILRNKRSFIPTNLVLFLAVWPQFTRKLSFQN